MSSRYQLTSIEEYALQLTFLKSMETFLRPKWRPISESNFKEKRNEDTDDRSKLREFGCSMKMVEVWRPL